MAIAPPSCSFEVFVGFFRSFSATWRADNIAFLDEERLIHFFNCSCFFAYCGSNIANTCRSALKFVNKCRKDTIVHFIEAIGINIQGTKTMFGNTHINNAIAQNLRKVAHSAQKPRLRRAISKAASEVVFTFSKCADRKIMPCKTSVL